VCCALQEVVSAAHLGVACI